MTTLTVFSDTEMSRQDAFDVAMQGDRRKHPVLVRVRPMTKAEVWALPSGGHVYTILLNNRLGQVKITSIKTWKRQPERLEIHVKYRMYEFATLSLDEALRRFVVVV